MVVLSDFGVNDPEKGIDKLWKKHGFPTFTRNGVTTTPPVQSMFRDDANREAAKNFWKREFLGLEYEDEQKNIGGPSEGTEGKAVDATIAEDPTPLVYDPEVLDILADNAPAVAMIPEEGQQGYKAVYNRIDERDDAIGFVSEGTSLDLINHSREFGTTRDEVDMKIYVDAVRISEFSERATAHYMDLSDTALGARISEHAMNKEQAYFYADPSAGLQDGSPGSEYAYPGLSTIFASAGNQTDKSAIDVSNSEALLQDIKGEIKDTMQGPYNINKGDLRIFTSHTLFDTLENELMPRARYTSADQQGGIDYGVDQIYVSGVPVTATHNIDTHTWEDDAETPNTYTAGSQGDVFIVNTASTRFRSLMPLSTVPLAKQGFSEQVALGEFGALVERSGGHFGKHLAGYAV